MTVQSCSQRFEVVQTERAVAGVNPYFMLLIVGAIQEKTKSVISGNCATIRPRAGTPMKLTMRSQKCAPSEPGSVLVMWLRVLSRSRPANTRPTTVPINSSSNQERQRNGGARREGIEAHR